MDYMESLYTTGEFASIMDVNKRTLHYYNDIGLFRPVFTDANGYHRYAPFQTLDFALLQTLRRMGLSIDEIRKYTDNPTGESFRTMLEGRMEALDMTIRQLMAEKKLLERKMTKLSLSEKAVHGLIEEVDLPRRHILLSGSIEKKTEDETLDVLAAFTKKLRAMMDYDNFGTRIKLSNAEKGAFDSYDSFFAYTDGDTPGAVPLAEGHWLRAFSVGPWDRIGEVYASMAEYAGKRGLEPVGYAYEEGLNEMNFRCGRDGTEDKIDMNEGHVTMILIEVV